MSGSEATTTTTTITSTVASPTTNPSINPNAQKKEKLSFGIKVGAENDDFDGTYSDSGEDSGSEQGVQDSEHVDEEEVGSDEDHKKSPSEKKAKKGSKKASKSQQAKKKPYQLVMNVSDTQYPVVRFVGKKLFKWKLCYKADNLDCDMFWTDNAVQPETLGKMQPHQKINHFPGMFVLARKNYLARNLKKMQKQFPEHYKFFPQTWLLPTDYNELRNEFEKTSKGKCKTFIVKPEASCQGRGIFLTRNLDDLNSTDHYVVQRYLHKPYLIDGQKFDFRIYVLLAGCDPMRIFVFKEGLARLATEEYEAPHRDNLDNLCMHLTNYAINKDNPNFEFNEDENAMDVGHKRSMTSVMELLQEQGHDVEKLWKQIKEILIKTIVSAQPTLSHHYKSCQPDNYMNNMCFEILGFDVMLDSHLRPWLLEINHTPSFTTDTPLDSLIKKNCIHDSLVLMNVNNKARSEIMAARQEQTQKRVLTGKKVKLTPEEKQVEIKKCMQKRDEYEFKNLGNFEKVYPLEPGVEDIYIEMQNHALQIYENWTGANIRRVPKKDGTATGIEVSSVKGGIVPKPVVNQQKPRTSFIVKSGQPIQPQKQKENSLPPARQIHHSNTLNLGVSTSNTPNSINSRLRLSISLEGEDGQIPAFQRNKISNNQPNGTVPQNTETGRNGASRNGQSELSDHRIRTWNDKPGSNSNGGVIFASENIQSLAQNEVRNQYVGTNFIGKQQNSPILISSFLPTTSQSHSQNNEDLAMNPKKQLSNNSDSQKFNSNLNMNINKSDRTISNNQQEIQQAVYPFARKVSTTSQAQNLLPSAISQQQQQSSNTISKGKQSICFMNAYQQHQLGQQSMPGKGNQGYQRVGQTQESNSSLKFSNKPLQNATNNGLYLQPKLFDINSLMKMTGCDDERKDQNNKVSQQPRSQGTIGGISGFHSQNLNEGNYQYPQLNLNNQYSSRRK